MDSVISKAWFKLSRNIGKTNQAIVVSGESGSGKTFSACLAMKCIACLQKNRSKNPSENILWQAWSSVPLLTAFGKRSKKNVKFCVQTSYHTLNKIIAFNLNYFNILYQYIYFFYL